MAMMTILAISIVGCGSEKSESVNTENSIETNIEASSETVEEISDDTASEDFDDSDETSVILDTSDASAQTTVNYKGTKFSMFENPDDVLAKINAVSEVVNTDEGDGYANYYYDDILIGIEDAGSGMEISTISIVGEGIYTSAGIGLGASVDEVKAAHGEPSSEELNVVNGDNITSMFYTYESFQLVFYFFEGELQSIDIYRIYG